MQNRSLRTHCVHVIMKMLSHLTQCPRSPVVDMSMPQGVSWRPPIPRGPPPLRCSTPETAQEPSRQHDSAHVSSNAPEAPSQGNNWLAVGAVSVAAAAVLVSRGFDGGPALARLQKASVPLEAALSNGRPTVLEFYADWCAVCNELAPATLEVLCRRAFPAVCSLGKAPDASAPAVAGCRLRRSTRTG